jgi:4'-phosphopantetheinyl transferase EntD
VRVEAEAAKAIGGLFAENVAAAVATLAHEAPCPYRSELRAIAGARCSRRREFLAGRACAHAALRVIGRDGQPVSRAATREPLWPDGVVGSISHAGTYAAAIVARGAEAWSVGLDIELLDPPLDAALERMVLTPSELAGSRRLAKIAFAVKECVYKCLFPRTGWRLGFHDVAVEIDPARGCYRAAVDERFRLGRGSLPALEGRLAIWNGYVLVGLSWREPIRAAEQVRRLADISDPEHAHQHPGEAEAKAAVGRASELEEVQVRADRVDRQAARGG